MKPNVAEKRLDLVMTSALCSECGCWAEGYSTHFLEGDYGYTYSVWPDIEPNGEYSFANFEFMSAMDTIGRECRIEVFHFEYGSALFMIRWYEPDRTIMTLNLFIDPPSQETLERVLKQQYDNLTKKLKMAAEIVDQVTKTAVNLVNAISDPSLEEKVSKILSTLPGFGEEKKDLNETLLCDVLTLAGYRAVEGEITADIEADEAHEAYEWAAAQVFGHPVSLVAESPPNWILDLERIIG